MRIAVIVAIWMMAFASGAASAQQQTVVGPVFGYVDERGVDLTVFQGKYSASPTDVVIGNPGAGGIAHGRHWLGTGWRDSLAGTISNNGTTYTVSLGDNSDTFTLAAGVYTTVLNMGSTLSFNGTTNKYTYTMRDGSVAVFDKALANAANVTNYWSSNQGSIVTLSNPDGEVLTWTYTTATVSGQTARRPQSISNNLNYMIHYSYATNNPTTTTQLTGDYLRRYKVIGINRSIYNCALNATICSETTGAVTWPYAGYDDNASVSSVTDQMGSVTRYYMSSSLLTGIRFASASTNNISIAYSSGNVSSVTVAGQTWSYAVACEPVSCAGSAKRKVTITSPAGKITKVLSSRTTGAVTDFQEGASSTRVLTLTRDAYGRVTRVARTEGDYTNYTLDARGNVTQVTNAPKTGSALANIVTSATFPASCAAGEEKRCNLPTVVTDARGFSTDYQYSIYGLAEKITLPAPTGTAPYGSGVRPETRFTYGDAGTGVFRLTATSACATGSSCASASTETVNQFTYNSQRAVLSSTIAAGDLSGSSTIAVTYTEKGSIATVDGPLSGAADTAYNYYDVRGRLVATVSPDPDGAGSLQHRVQRTTYTSERVTAVDVGYVSSPASWASMTVVQKLETGYGADGLPNKQTAWANSQVFSSTSPTSGMYRYAIGQTGYDPDLRQNCTTTRMSPGRFDSAQPPPCTSNYGSTYGQDRITQLNYQGGTGDLATARSGIGTVFDRTEINNVYAAGGSLTSLRDAANAKSAFEYDGFNRQLKFFYPNPTTSSSSSTTDYQQVAYDNYGRLTQAGVRGGALTTRFEYDYDNLGRIVTVNAPGSDPDITYAYDNFGRVTQSSQTGHVISYVYDALNRVRSETQAGRTVSYQYDAAGRRTRMTWPDGFYVTYDYDDLGEVTAIRENGATSGAAILAILDYDNLGRRTASSRGNGSTTSWGYDGASRLTTQAHAVVSDPSKNYAAAHVYNPAGQIIESSQTSAYVAALPSGVAETYAVNLLNQMTTVNGVAASYDARGNMTNDGTRSYTYDYRNRMTSAGTVSMTYDPSGRLYEVAASPAVQFLYDGVDIVAEYTASGTLLRRYVHGPERDEPIVGYEGAGHSLSGTPDRRNFFADERGSIIAVEKIASPSSVTIDTYTPYGKPGAGQTERFQYTGQPWIREVGLSYYKARFYNADIGRFMQADPSGYDDGMNLFAYVHGDPTNARDPSGKSSEWCFSNVILSTRTSVTWDGATDRLLITDTVYRGDVCFFQYVWGVDMYEYPLGSTKTARTGPSIAPITNQDARCRVMTQIGEDALGRMNFPPGSPSFKTPQDVTTEVDRSKGKAGPIFDMIDWFTNGTGRYDYKSKDPNGAAWSRDGDDYGNVLYGAVGKKLGFSGLVLNETADYLQALSALVLRGRLRLPIDDARDSSFSRTGQLLADECLK